MNNSTQVKVQRNLSGLQYLMNRQDTSSLNPQSKTLDTLEDSPAFHSCRLIMADGLTVIQISLRVSTISFSQSGETYTHKDVYGRGTTFEMALFDLSAQLIHIINDDECIDTERLPIIEKGAENVNSNKSVCTNTPSSSERVISDTQSNEQRGVAARSNNSGGGGADAKRNIKRGRKTSTRHSGGGCSKRSGR